MASIDFPKRFEFQFPLGIVSWKGQTLYQVVSKFRRVKNAHVNNKLYFQPNPVTKIYRRESIFPDSKVCQPSRISFALPEKPGSVYTTKNALVADGVLDPHYPNLQAELNLANCCPSNTVSFLPEFNAKRRCRSAGMISNKFIEGGDRRAYFTNNKQYLHSRNRTIAQNEYVHIRQGGPTPKPETAWSKSNIYSPFGLSYCPKYTISAALGNNTLKYTYDPNPPVYTVTFPDGDYDIFELNNEFTNRQIANNHAIQSSANNTYETLIKFGYDTTRGVPTIFFYSADGGGGVYRTPQIEFLNNSLGPIGFGLQKGTYLMTNNSQENVIIYGTPNAKLSPSYEQLYYKPSNAQFATQGGVSSSARVLRVKYNEMQKAAKNTTGFGNAMASSLAYHVPTPDYPTTAKAKLGYPLTSTPVFKTTGMVCQ